MSSLWRDLRYSLRGLRKAKGFAAVAVLTLAVGIGVNAAVFTITNAVLFKGFPFADSGRIVYLGSKNLRRVDSTWGPVSYPDLLDWREASKSFTGLAAALGGQQLLDDGTALPDVHLFTRITSNTFQLIGQKPILGRDFTPADEVQGAPQVTILNYGFWESRYGRDKSVIGRAVRMNGILTTIVGVMPQGFTFPLNVDFWVALGPRAETQKREARNLLVFGKLAEGSTLESARAEMQTISGNLQKEYPLTNQGFSPVVLTYNEFYVGPRVTAIFLAMLFAVAFVLLIACGNVANLLLARGLSRTREISIRLALGSSRWALVRQLLVESLLLSVAGGLLGWLIAYWGVRIFDSATAQYRPKWTVFTMDVRVVLYLAAITVATGILFGLAPALRLTKIDVNSTLKDGGHGTSAGGHSKRLSAVLVVSEMAIAIVLLAGAGLMIRSFLNIYRAALGVTTTNVLSIQVGLPQARYGKPSDQIAYFDRLLPRLAALPGVDSVALGAPPTGGSQPFPYELEGSPSDERHRPSLSVVVVSPDYFRVLRVGLLEGRAFTDEDGRTGPPVVIVNRQFAGNAWQGQDPIGKRLQLFDGGTAEPWVTVVGVVPNIVQNDVSPRQIDPLIYLPYRQKPAPIMNLLAKTMVPPAKLLNPFRQEALALDSAIPVTQMLTLDERLARNSWVYRVTGTLFVVFAVVALLLASVGLYAVMAHSVGQRTQEIGVRMAMGASAADVLRLVFQNGMRQVLIGLAIGLVVALGATRILKAALVQVSPADPVTFIFAAAVLIAAGILGCLLPARRAVRVDPVFALRHE